MTRPSIADTAAEVEAILLSLPGRFRPDRAEDYTAVFHWEVAGAEKPSWTVRIGAGSCEVEPGHEGDADCTIRMSQKTFLAVETGQRNPVFAFVKGKIKVTNVGHMRRFDRAFFKFHDVPKTD